VGWKESLFINFHLLEDTMHRDLEEEVAEDSLAKDWEEEE